MSEAPGMPGHEQPAAATGPRPDDTPWAAKQSILVRFVLAFFASVAPVIPVGGLAIMGMMMMAFMGDGGFRNEELAEAGMIASMLGFCILGSSGLPLAAGLVAGKSLRPFLLVMIAWIALGVAVLVGGFAGYYANFVT